MSDNLDNAVYEREKNRRGYLNVRAIDFHNGQEWDLLIPPSLQKWVQKSGVGKTKELIESVRWVLLNPRAIFRGIRDIDKEIEEDSWLCYTAVPPAAYDYKTGNRRAPWEGEVMLVYVNDDREVYSWCWAQADTQQSYLPVDYATRFSEKVF